MSKMRRLISAFLAMAVCAAAIPSFAEGEPSIYVEGVPLAETAAPVVTDGTVYLPLRAVSEALGIPVDWDSENNAVIVGDRGVLAPSEEIQIAVDGKTVDSAHLNIDGTVYLPTDVMSEALDIDAVYENGAAYITSRPVTIVIGTHVRDEDDPFYFDERGFSYFDENGRRAAEIALAKVKAELGVNIEWKQYTTDTQIELLRSVLAGQPFCDLAVLWNGIQVNVMLLSVLQPLDPYVDKVFLGENAADKEWLLQGKTLGGYYLLNRDYNFVHTWPLVYNIKYIEAVPELKEADGTTLYPSELYERGEWTWSRFEDYLSKIQNYYRGYPASYDTNYSYAALAAAASAGKPLFDGESLYADSDEIKEAVAYFDKMIDSRLISCSTASENSYNAGWLTGTDNFIFGKTVFTNCSPWRMDDAGEWFSENGTSMGIIPFPKPDGREDYSILSASGDSVGLVRGINSRRSELALEAYAMYKSEYYKALAGADTIAEAVDKLAEVEAAQRGIDILHPEIGEANLRIFKEMAAVPTNDFSESLGVFGAWADIVGKAVYGYQGSPEYPEALEAHRSSWRSIYNKIDELKEALMKNGPVDDMEPYAAKHYKNPKELEFPMGTALESIDWGEYLYANDMEDGEYEIRKENGETVLYCEDYITKDYVKVGPFKVDCSKVDVNTPGSYTITVRFADRAGNPAEAEFEVVIK
ncbi:MAG: extracellular solute-binding protein [Oscillospiraceae bacterium]|nr:extracellular solute-binding protein [Oscillospiraceae bacterium]